MSTKPPCRHIWIFQKREGSEGNITYDIHQCPKCGYLKKTLRLSRRTPPLIKWGRELEKLIERAGEAGYFYEVHGENIAGIYITQPIE